MIIMVLKIDFHKLYNFYIKNNYNSIINHKFTILRIEKLKIIYKNL